VRDDFRASVVILRIYDGDSKDAQGQSAAAGRDTIQQCDGCKNRCRQ
jgi:hypothetical protein